MAENHVEMNSAGADGPIDSLKHEVGKKDTDKPDAVGETSSRTPTQFEILISVAGDCELFHAPNGVGFADIDVDGHRETWQIRSKSFRRWLLRRFYLETGRTPNAEVLKSAIDLLEARAQFDAPERSVFVRIGSAEGKIYLDLGDATWRAIEVDEAGWRIIDTPPMRFRRSPGMQPLPEPIRGGSIAKLRDFLNIETEHDFILFVAWLLAVFGPGGPYPLLVLAGEQGSAKSTFSAILRALTDPNSAPLRALPREERDLFIAANNSHVLAFDNVSGLPFWMSDTLCRLASGGGFAVRQLYTDADEMLFEASRPVILNGIEDIVTRPDLADRALLLTLQTILEEDRRSEQNLWTAFSEAQPAILGALLDAVAHGLHKLPSTKPENLPRMADFALWISACEGALWPAGTFLKAYQQNRDDAVSDVVEYDDVASAVRRLMRTRMTWTGTATDLLEGLTDYVPNETLRSKEWPRTARALSGRLRRAATFLRKAGVEITLIAGGMLEPGSLPFPGSPKQRRADRQHCQHRHMGMRTRADCGRKILTEAIGGASAPTG
jgi:hypothetical protein